MLVFLVCLFSGIHWKTIDLTEHDVYNVSAVALSDQGVLAVMDNDQKQLLFFDPGGTFIKRLGRAGQGPEEFSYVPEIRWSKRDDAFLAFDEVRSRVSKWSPNQGFISGFKLPRHRWMEFLYRTPSGGMVFAVDVYGYNGANPRILIWEEQIAKTVIEITDHKKYPGTAKTPMGPFGMVNHFHPRLLMAMGSNYLAVCFNRDDLVEYYSPDGTVLKKSVRPKLRSFKITKEYLEQWLREHETFVQQMVKVSELDHPEFLPKIDHLIIDDQDRLWVFGNRSFEQETVEVEVFDRFGQALGFQKLPKIPFVIHGGQGVFLMNRYDRPKLTNLKIFE